MPGLFDQLTLRGVTLRNRVAMSPMCTYSARDGLPSSWHMAHLGSRAIGGAGLVMTEASAVEPRGRISPADTGLWNDVQAEAWRGIVRLVRGLQATPGIQLAHAGRKAGTRPPWQGRGVVPESEGGWVPVGPSPLPFQEGYRTPHPLEPRELRELVEQWRLAAVRAREIGFAVLEIHMAHGYLLHQFLSPLTNRREDAYGGSLENRMRFPLEVAAAVRSAWPQDRPLFVRISATDWASGGWDLDQAVHLCGKLGEAGVDLVDCSSGGAVPHQEVHPAPGYQVPFAERIRREARIATGAVGMITDPQQAEEIVREGRADLVLLGRELLRDPHWPIRAARVLQEDPPWPEQYRWAVG